VHQMTFRDGKTCLLLSTKIFENASFPQFKNKQLL